MFKAQRFLPVLFIAAGIVFVISQVPVLRDHQRHARWKQVQAVVESAHVVGKRAFRPEVGLRYVVDDSSYNLISSMDVPGFGSKSNRLNVAEHILAKLSVGDSLPIYYDPDHPSDAVLHRGLLYSNYLIGTTGACFILLGLVLGILWRRRSSQSQ